MESVAVHQTRREMSGRDFVRDDQHCVTREIAQQWSQLWSIQRLKLVLAGVELEGDERQDNDQMQYKEQG